MSYFTYVNFYETTLSAALSSTATTMNVSTASGLPSSLASGEIIPIVLTAASNNAVHEIVYVTAISGTTLTITRGEESTSALSWSIGDYVACGTTAGSVGASNIQNATANNEPVALGQFAIMYPSVFAANVGSATSLSLTTGSFTAPSNGTLLIFASMGSNGADWFGNSGSISVSAGQSLTQAFAEFDYGAVGNGNVQLTSGQSCTVTYATGTVSTAAGIYLNIQLIFVPTT